MFSELFDIVTDVAEEIARATGNHDLADLIDDIDDLIEDIIED